MNFIFAASIILAALPAAAHEIYPISPAEVDIRVEPGRVVANVDVDSIYWIEEVLAMHTLPPRDWPAPAIAKAENYINNHLRLAVDQRPLQGRLVSAVYVQRPWQVNEEGRMRFRLVYPPADGTTLSGEADFYEEYRREMATESGPPPVGQDFRVLLKVSGRDGRAFELTHASPSFTVPVAPSQRSALQMARESLWVGIATVFGTIEGWPVLLALALSLSPGKPPAWHLGALLVAAAFGAALAPQKNSSSWMWIFGAMAALAAGRWRGPRFPVRLEIVSAAGILLSWMTLALIALPRATPGTVDRGFAAVGMIVASAAVLAIVMLGIEFQRRELVTHSESRAPELFERRRRLAATVLLLACAWSGWSRFSR